MSYLQHTNFMRKAIIQAKMAEYQDEVPVGAVLVKDQQVIAEAYNQPIQNHDASAHAEIMVLRKAGQVLKNYRLNECDLYVTLEPCPMCAGAIIQARIRRLIFGAYDLKGGAAGSCFQLLPSDARFNHKTQVISGVLEKECSTLLSQFFQYKRALKKANKKSI